MQLSFPVYLSYEKQKPILPISQPISANEPIQNLTTNKHDFICNPVKKLEPIKPKNSIELSKCPFEQNTTMKLSYQSNKPDCYIMLKSFKPVHQYTKPKGIFLI